MKLRVVIPVLLAGALGGCDACFVQGSMTGKGKSSKAQKKGAGPGGGADNAGPIPISGDDAKMVWAHYVRPVLEKAAKRDKLAIGENLEKIQVLFAKARAGVPEFSKAVFAWSGGKGRLLLKVSRDVVVDHFLTRYRIKFVAWLIKYPTFAKKIPGVSALTRLFSGEGLVRKLMNRLGTSRFDRVVKKGIAALPTDQANRMLSKFAGGAKKLDKVTEQVFASYVQKQFKLKVLDPEILEATIKTLLDSFQKQMDTSDHKVLGFLDKELKKTSLGSIVKAFPGGAFATRYVSSIKSAQKQAVWQAGATVSKQVATGLTAKAGIWAAGVKLAPATLGISLVGSVLADEVLTWAMKKSKGDPKERLEKTTEDYLLRLEIKLLHGPAAGKVKKKAHYPGIKVGLMKILGDYAKQRADIREKVVRGLIIGAPVK